MNLRSRVTFRDTTVYECHRYSADSRNKNFCAFLPFVAIFSIWYGREKYSKKSEFLTNFVAIWFISYEQRAKKLTFLSREWMISKLGGSRYPYNIKFSNMDQNYPTWIKTTQLERKLAIKELPRFCRYQKNFRKIGKEPWPGTANTRTVQYCRGLLQNLQNLQSIKNWNSSMILAHV